MLLYESRQNGPRKNGSQKNGPRKIGTRKNGPQKNGPGKFRYKNRGVSVEHRGVCVERWDVINL